MTAKLVLIALFVFCMIIMSLNHGRRKKKILFLGESINDMDKRPGGFVSWVMQGINEDSLEGRYQVTQSLRSGEKIYDLYLCIDENLQVKESNIVVLHIGVHDVWDKYLKGTGTSLKTFKHVLQAVINKLLTYQVKIMICVPDPMLQPGFSDTMLSDFYDYAQAIKTVCEQNQLACIELENIFEKAAVGHYDDPAEFNVNKALGVHIWRMIKEATSIV